MIDRNGKPLSVGDLFVVVGPLDPEHNGDIGSVYRVEAFRRMADANWEYRCTDCDGGVSIVHDTDWDICPCHVIKISPDADQFEDEREREVEHG